MPRTSVSMLGELPRRLGIGVRVQDHGSHQSVETGAREERLHDAIEDGLPRQLDPGVLEWRNVRRMRNDALDQPHSEYFWVIDDVLDGLRMRCRG
jgi:hypothetical protein